jgi:nucleoside-diphosphate-sugar epimerase
VSTDSIIEKNENILVTGASGLIGPKLVAALARLGYTRITCMVRPSSNVAKLDQVAAAHPNLRLSIVRGNLLRRDDCKRATEGAAVVYHLAAGTGDKSYAGSFLNSVVTTRNLLDCLRQSSSFKRFVNVSSFSVYSGTDIRPGAVLDESCPLEAEPQLRNEAYCFGKLKQDQLVIDYGDRYSLPYVIMRPAVVYGPGRTSLTGRVGVASFGLYLHIGGSNRIPLTYVDNCADALVLGGLVPGIGGQVFNVVDDDLPRSRTLLREYKKRVRKFQSIYIPHPVSRALCILWERCSNWSRGQLPPAYNRREWATYWQGNQYSNAKLKTLGWKQGVATEIGLSRFFDYCREVGEAR